MFHGDAPTGHDLRHVRAMIDLLDGAGIATWLFGGWAEEVLGLQRPREHRDVDLLYPAANFSAVDRWLRRGQVEEIAAKRFHHKRAFLSAGIMTEIIMVHADLTTVFWGQHCFQWPPDTFDHRAGGLRVASPAALAAYSAAHAHIAMRDGYTPSTGD